MSEFRLIHTNGCKNTVRFAVLQEKIKMRPISTSNLLKRIISNLGWQVLKLRELNKEEELNATDLIFPVELEIQDKIGLGWRIVLELEDFKALSPAELHDAVEQKIRSFIFSRESLDQQK